VTVKRTVEGLPVETYLRAVNDALTPVERLRADQQTYERLAREAKDGFVASSFMTLAVCARMLADALERTGSA
jgi:hypothetical protein